MKNSVFQHADYKAFLKAQIEANDGVVGYKSRLAKAIRTPASFLSQVLHSSAHLTQDHAFRLARFWALSDDERDCFLDLLSFARAASPEFRAFLENRIQERKRQQEDMATRFKKPALETTDDQWTYYTAWQMAAVHLLATIPAFQSPQTMASRLQVPRGLIEQTLVSLKGLGLVEEKSGVWKATKNSIHLAKQSPASPVNHMIWRQRAVQDIYSMPSDSVHYTALHTMSRSDMERIRGVLYSVIDETRGIVAESPEEDLACLSLDFFRV